MKMMKKTTFWLLTLALRLSSVASDSYNNEFLVLEGHKVKNDYSLPLPYEYISEDELPEEFSWGNVKGISYLTPSLNQHIPQYCGSCWAHGALSSLADRLKIARGAKGVEVNLSIQYILNCGGDVAGSCHGGSHTGVYEFISKHSGFVPFDTCMPYVACSKESSEGFCKHVDTTCTSTNTCRTCHGFGNPCQQLDYFPNVTIAEYGSYNLFTRNKVHKIKAEIFARGPVAASINALPLENYEGGIVTNGNWLYKLPNHIVSIVGWGKDEKSGIEYWIVRNSWGQYWGEMGFFRIELGKNSLGIEDDVAWATPKTWTEHNYHVDNFVNNVYVDPSVNQEVTKGLLRKRV